MPCHLALARPGRRSLQEPPRTGVYDEADGCADVGAPPLLGSVYAGESERAASMRGGGWTRHDRREEDECPRREIATAVKWRCKRKLTWPATPRATPATRARPPSHQSLQLPAAPLAFSISAHSSSDNVCTEQSRTQCTEEARSGGGDGGGGGGGGGDGGVASVALSSVAPPLARAADRRIRCHTSVAATAAGADARRRVGRRRRRGAAASSAHAANLPCLGQRDGGRLSSRRWWRRSETHKARRGAVGHDRRTTGRRATR